MTDRLDHAEIESLLVELEASTGRSRADVLLDALRHERDRLEQRREAVAEALRIDEELRQRLNARPLIDPRPIDEILAYDENGLPV